MSQPSETSAEGTILRGKDEILAKLRQTVSRCIAEACGDRDPFDDDDWDAIHRDLDAIQSIARVARGLPPLPKEPPEPAADNPQLARLLALADQFGPAVMQAIDAYVQSAAAQQRSYSVGSHGATIANLAQALASLKRRRVGLQSSRRRARTSRRRGAKATSVTAALEMAIIRLTSALVPPPAEEPSDV